MKLITCVEINQKFGNLYEVADAALWTESDQGKLQNAISSSLETAPKSTTNFRQAYYGSPPETLQQSVEETKDLSSSKLSKTSLSQFIKPSELSILETRWISFSEKERAREEKGLLKLIVQKPQETTTILKAFEIILKEQDEYGEIKSAIAVLETNYSGQYRAKALAAIARLKKRSNENSVQTEIITIQSDQQDAEAKTQLIRMQCFQDSFPDLVIRKQFILNTCSRNPIFAKFDVTSPIAVSYAISQWAQGEGSRRVLEALDSLPTESKK